jgi:hypothetical protein
MTDSAKIKIKESVLQFPDWLKLSGRNTNLPNQSHLPLLGGLFFLGQVKTYQGGL